jgi:hypothetical protein
VGDDDGDGLARGLDMQARSLALDRGAGLPLAAIAQNFRGEPPDSAGSARFTAAPAPSPIFGSMKSFFRVLGAFELASAAWLLADRRGWSRYWTRFLKRVGRRRDAASAIALVELAFGVYFLARPPGRRRLASP